MEHILPFITVAALAAEAVLLALGVRRLSANEKKGALRDESQRMRDQAIAKQFRDLQETFDLRAKEQIAQLKESTEVQLRRNQVEHADHQEQISGLNERVDYLEKDYLSRDEHYRDFSGWRAEINRMGAKMDKVLLAIGRWIGGKK